MNQRKNMHRDVTLEFGKARYTFTYTNITLRASRISCWEKMNEPFETKVETSSLELFNLSDATL